MGGNYKLVVVLVVALVVLLEGSTVSSLCNMTDEGIADCKPSVTKTNPTPPTPECCEALKGADLKCLCGYKNSFLLPSLGIDPTLAMALPAKCNLTPPNDC
ncbi:putative lipid-transfer protein DIR1 [Pyrus x bretschneideri]|uniref:putative lipid-transfer protein DIR1 n=1 Tax=Pyrus x bretschneideri TaxID=225117 RepID=UPI00202F3CCD|nr:putative lipid-transfer protein DIR1 [Pyrus x bretschneideri]